MVLSAPRRNIPRPRQLRQVPDPACIFLHTTRPMRRCREHEAWFYLKTRSPWRQRSLFTPGLRYDWYDQSPQDTPAYRKNINYDGAAARPERRRGLSKLLAKACEVAPDLALFANGYGISVADRNRALSRLRRSGHLSRARQSRSVPETSRGFEVGAILWDEDLGGRITGFYNRYRNFIDRQISGFQDPAYPLASPTPSIGIACGSMVSRPR